jgi:hypothetical protein
LKKLWQASAAFATSKDGFDELAKKAYKSIHFSGSTARSYSLEVKMNRLHKMFAEGIVGRHALDKIVDAVYDVGVPVEMLQVFTSGIDDDGDWQKIIIALCEQVRK